jgi:hypothetical protein
MSRIFVDDNYGTWSGMDDPEIVKFYHETRKKSVKKICSGCGRTVIIKPEYDYCNSCADKKENGGEY